MLPSIDGDAVKAGFDLVKGAIDTIKGVKDLLPTKSAGRDELQRKIELAERQLALGEAQLAQALGYRLCRAHFPPVPMLKDRVHLRHVEEISKCPTCGLEEPSPEYFDKIERTDRMFADHNERMAREADHWMSR